MIHTNLFQKITSLENLLISWREFCRGKRGKPDVQEFERNLEDNLFTLHSALITKTYQHGKYTPFTITDPKVRRIHKAAVMDRVVHHAVYRILYPIFDRTFIFDSYSCRIDKGTHKAVDRLEHFVRKVSKNYTQPCFALKCDVKKFFDSVDHEILLYQLKKRVHNPNTLWLLQVIIGSFSVASEKYYYHTNDSSKCLKDLVRERERERERESSRRGCGIPIGNLTSQLFANIYLNELDQFMEHTLRVKNYVRYCDDFVVVAREAQYFAELVGAIEQFLRERFLLSLHDDKIIIRKLRQGIDFLGYVVLPHHRVLRTRTKRRMLRRVNGKNIASYRGLLQHCDGYRLSKELEPESKIDKN